MHWLFNRSSVSIYCQRWFNECIATVASVLRVFISDSLDGCQLDCGDFSSPAVSSRGAGVLGERLSKLGKQLSYVARRECPKLAINISRWFSVYVFGNVSHYFSKWSRESWWLNGLARLQLRPCYLRGPGFKSHLWPVKFFACNKVFPQSNLNAKICAMCLNKLATSYQGHM